MVKVPGLGGDSKGHRIGRGVIRGPGLGGDVKGTRNKKEGCKGPTILNVFGLAKFQLCDTQTLCYQIFFAISSRV